MELLCKCKDATGSIRIPGMYDDVAPPAPVERESWKQLPFDEAEFLRSEVGATELIGEAGYSVLERVWARPTMEVHGIAGGFTGAGSKTVIPSKAVAKVSFRLVPNQNPDKIIKSFGDFLQYNAPPGIRIRTAGLERSAGGDGGSRSSRHSGCRRGFQRHAWQAHGAHAQRRLHSGGRRFRDATWACPPF